ncbi:MAG: hypothetical protein JWM59_918 [Verrucomicrobiales bacterium]|nr:hypothetical protein [Verrucomicrobiales bacterium]
MTPRNSSPCSVHDKLPFSRAAGSLEEHGRPAGRQDRIAWAIVTPQSPAGKTPQPQNK